jgi:hypothetical protein
VAGGGGHRRPVEELGGSGERARWVGGGRRGEMWVMAVAVGSDGSCGGWAAVAQAGDCGGWATAA